MNYSDAVSRVLSALDSPKRSGSGWSARCPAHNDRVASLTVSQGDDGRALLHCHSGCRAEDIASACGLKMQDLFEDRLMGAPPPRRRADAPQRDWPSLVKRYIGELTPGLLESLARSLCVSEESLQAVGLGWDGSRYTFPEHDGAGAVIGISTRSVSGEKRSVAGSRRGLTVPAGLREMADPVLVVEGASDVAACWMFGLAAVGRPSNSGGAEHLERLLRGREVLVVGERDEKKDGRWPGKEGAISVSGALAAAWGSPVLWALPPEPAKDARSWFVSRMGSGEAPSREAGLGFISELRECAEEESGWREGFRASLDEAVGGGAGEEKKRKGKRPNDMALDLMGEHELMVDPESYPYEYDGRCWNRITPGVLMKYALEVDGHRHTSDRRRRETIAYVKASVQRTEVRWNAVAESEVPLKSGVLDVLSMDERAHSPDDMLETVTPWEWSPKAECPLWLDCLDMWFHDVEEKDQKLALLQEMFGYALLPHARFKRALVLYGDPDTGKSVIVNVMHDLVGEDNVCSIGVDAMDDPRLIAPIKGKALNLISELTAKSMIADAGFKRLVSAGDKVMLDEKWGLPQMYEPRALHVIATNVLPRCNDETRATFNRLGLIRCERVIPDSEKDPHLDRKLLMEMPGILRWAVEGAARLCRGHGRFTRVRSSEAIVEEYRREQNPMNAFLEEFCPMSQEEGVRIEVNALRKVYSKWNGRDVSPQQIGRLLRAAGEETVQLKVDGRKKRFLLGRYLVDGDEPQSGGEPW